MQHLSLTFLHFIPPSLSPSGVKDTELRVPGRLTGVWGGLVLPSALLRSHSFMNVTSAGRSRWNLQTLSRELGKREQRGMSEGRELPIPLILVYLICHRHEVQELRKRSVRNLRDYRSAGSSITATSPGSETIPASHADTERCLVEARRRESS